MISVLVSAVVLSAPPQLSFSFGFEPRIGGYTALDTSLMNYGFSPVGSPVLPSFGLRGRAFFPNGLMVGLAMTYGVRTGREALPTTATLTETTIGIGYRTSLGLFASLDAGFSFLSQAVASRAGGGALLYPGPVIHPRVGWVWQFFEPFGWFLAGSIGVSVHVPMGPAHTNPLWEEPFRRGVLPAFTVGLESGFGLKERAR
jgi:hypothetical protein